MADPGGGGGGGGGAAAAPGNGGGGGGGFAMVDWLGLFFFFFVDGGAPSGLGWPALPLAEGGFTGVQVLEMSPRALRPLRPPGVRGGALRGVMTTPAPSPARALTSTSFTDTSSSSSAIFFPSSFANLFFCACSPPATPTMFSLFASSAPGPVPWGWVGVETAAAGVLGVRAALLALRYRVGGGSVRRIAAGLARVASSSLEDSSEESSIIRARIRAGDGFFFLPPDLLLHPPESSPSVSLIASRLQDGGLAS